MHMNAEDVEAILKRKKKFNIFKVTFKKSVDVLTTDRHNIFGSGSPVKGFFFFFLKASILPFPNCLLNSDENDRNVATGHAFRQ